MERIFNHRLVSLKIHFQDIVEELLKSNKIFIDANI